MESRKEEEKNISVRKNSILASPEQKEIRPIHGAESIQTR